MSSSSVWVQLYYEGKDEPKGRPVKIEPIPRNIGALAKATKAELNPKIDYAPLDEIFVYPPDTEPPFSQRTMLRGDKILKEVIDEFGNKTPPVSINYDHPLIVVAPDPPAQTENFEEPEQNKKQKLAANKLVDNNLLVSPAIIQPLQRASASKRPNIDELNSAASNEQILGVLRSFAEQHVMEEDSHDFCYPFMVSETWNQNQLKTLFLQKQATVLENIRKDDDNRAPLVVTVVAGLGNGKTHFLKAAPGFVGEESMFVTYNLGQDLATDISETRKALLLRIIFQTFGTGSIGAADFLTSREGKRLIEKWDYEKILDVAAERLAEKFTHTNGFFVCVDETRKLEQLKVGATADLLSVLGALAVKVYKSTAKLQCTPLVTALDNDGVQVYSASHGAVESLQLPIANSSAVEFVCRAMELPKELDWKVFTVAGSHFRSIVTAINILNEGSSHVDIERLFRLSFERLRQTLDTNTALTIKTYVKDMMEQGGRVLIPRLLRSLCSTDNAIPPTLICSAFQMDSALQQSGADEHVFRIFRNDIDNDAFSQLELSAMSFDLLRAVWEMKVIPSSMQVSNSPPWYSDLRFPRSLQASKEGILKTRSKKVVWTGLRPRVGVYYHPGLGNHPWIDRFFVAQTKDEKKCLVLYQDKINAAGFPDAVNHLNLAGNILREKLAMPVLCVANVIGASSQTTSQLRFEHPYLLVRDTELDAFYSINFSHAMRFLRSRFRDHGTKQVAGGAGSSSSSS